jgi:hypothetical protein
MRILIATSNNGKLRDFAGAAAVYGIVVEGLAGAYSGGRPMAWVISSCATV